MSKQKTALDIAFEKLANQGLLVTRDYKNLVVYRKAKEMEKEQIVDAIDYFKKRPYTDIEPEQYYNETYGGNK